MGNEELMSPRLLRCGVGPADLKLAYLFRNPAFILMDTHPGKKRGVWLLPPPTTLLAFSGAELPGVPDASPLRPPADEDEGKFSGDDVPGAIHQLLLILGHEYGRTSSGILDSSSRRTSDRRTRECKWARRALCSIWC